MLLRNSKEYTMCVEIERENKWLSFVYRCLYALIYLTCAGMHEEGGRRKE